MRVPDAVVELADPLEGLPCFGNLQHGGPLCQGEQGPELVLAAIVFLGVCRARFQVVERLRKRRVAGQQALRQRHDRRHTGSLRQFQS